MPNIRRWFDSGLFLAWDKQDESPWNGSRGEPYVTYPATWLIPYPELTLEDVQSASLPLWVTDLHYNSQLGKVCNEEEGTFIIDLPPEFDTYFKALPASSRKKFRAILNRNSDLKIIQNRKEDLEILWPFYVERLQVLAKNAGGEDYTDEELTLRKNFYTGAKISTLSFELDSELLALNVSFVEESTVFDLACLIRPTAEALRRSLGTVAILKNIELSIRQGKTVYDLLSREYGYKRSFGAREEKLKCLIVCSKEFAEHYRIPSHLYTESFNEVSLGR